MHSSDEPARLDLFILSNSTVERSGLTSLIRCLLAAWQLLCTQEQGVPTQTAMDLLVSLSVV